MVIVFLVFAMLCFARITHPKTKSANFHKELSWMAGWPLFLNAHCHIQTYLQHVCSRMVIEVCGGFFVVVVVAAKTATTQTNRQARPSHTASEPSFSMRFHYYNSNNYYLLRTYVCRVGMADVKLCRRDSSQQNIYEKSNPYYQRPEETTRTHRYKILRRWLLILCVVGVWRSLPNINRRQGKASQTANQPT